MLIETNTSQNTIHEKLGRKRRLVQEQEIKCKYIDQKIMQIRASLNKKNANKIFIPNHKK